MRIRGLDKISNLPNSVYTEYVKGCLITEFRDFVETDGTRRAGAVVECAYCKKSKHVRLNSISDFLLNKTKSNKLVYCIDCYPLAEYYKAYIKSAKERELDFDLSLVEFYTLVNQLCLYCDQYPEDKYTSNQKKNSAFNGIDRKYPTTGYTVENCVPCCTDCNMMKQGMTMFEFLQRVYEINKKHEANEWSVLGEF